MTSSFFRRFARSLSRAAAILAFIAGPALQAAQVGDAFLVFDRVTGRLSMNPGSGQITSYAVQTVTGFGLSFNQTAVFPSGTSIFTPDNTTSLIGNGFYSLTAPDIVPNSGFISSSNLQLSSSSGRVIPSTISGYVGTPEWSFGNVGTTGLSATNALAGLGAASDGALATGNQVYSLQGVTGQQKFKVYLAAAPVPEPSAVVMIAAATGSLLGVQALRRRRKDARR